MHMYGGKTTRLSQDLLLRDEQTRMYKLYQGSETVLSSLCPRYVKHLKRNSIFLKIRQDHDFQFLLIAFETSIQLRIAASSEKIQRRFRKAFFFFRSICSKQNFRILFFKERKKLVTMSQRFPTLQSMSCHGKVNVRRRSKWFFLLEQFVFREVQVCL